MKSLEEVLQDWEAVIGLEIHTELTTLESKMFCSCKLSHDDPPNTNVCPVCLGMPGALPVPNKQAIESIILAGLATNCDIEKETLFYRKNYFYPDMSKNFQITQGPLAFCMRGHLDVTIQGAGVKERVDRADTNQDFYVSRIGITRIHMEEDAGKLVHKGGEAGRITGAQYSLVDYNRCGMPLIELVTEPDLRTPEEARRFMETLRTLFLTLGISDCSMESGSMRCDGNVSLRRRGEQGFGTKTELKNMNSFKNLHDGLAYEICRQAEVLESGGTVAQETRHWEPSQKRTIVMRTKETADDYRLFPEPDLAPYRLTDEFIEGIRDRLPELPAQKRDRYQKTWDLSFADASQLAESVDVAAFFEHALASVAQEKQADAGALAQKLANLINNDFAAYAKTVEEPYAADALINAERLGELVVLLCEDTISSKQGKEVFALMAKTGDSPRQIVAEHGMEQVSDAGAIDTIVAAVLERCPDQVQQYRDGNQKVIGFLVGQCMKESKGQANPKLINESLQRMLNQ